MEIANGIEPDKIIYKTYLQSSNWIVEVIHPDGRRLSESFRCSFEPRCGPDVADVNNAEIIMEKLINNLREGGQKPAQ